MIQGLTYTYGISSIPGTLIENIYVSKGANSVLQGAESITGQINVTLKEPDQTDRLMVNAYANSFLEKQFNLNYAHKLNNWSSLAAVHAVLPADRFDRDGDNLLDLPLIRRYSVYNKWKYKTEDSIGFHTRFAFRLLSEKRTGGQQDFDEEIHKGSRSVYGQTVDITQPEFYTKTGFRFNEGNALSLLSSLSLHRQDSWFGNLSYEAEQTSANVTLQYEKRWLERHDLKTGVSYRHLYISENIRPADSIPLRTYYGSYRKNERTPGLFAENTFHWKEDKYVLITGVRLDNNSGFGYFLVPRTMLKYTLSENYILRASLGYGYRTVNLFSENVNLLASSRDVSIRGILHPEEAINWGVNFTGKIPWENIEGSYGLDFYQTRFLNQVYVDYDSNPLQAVVSDFSGISVSNGFQAETNLRFYERAELRLSYTWLDVYRIAGGLRDEIPFNPRHKILSALSYSPVSERWQADLNIHWYGRQRLPVTTANPEEFRRESFSDPYYTVNIQLTKKWERLQLYAGCENIFDFRQLRPVMGWENPFGPYFDTSFAWGPTRGREAYLGVRLTY
jgi:outer membrane receptor for ferrienterochelin and colicins